MQAPANDAAEQIVIAMTTLDASADSDAFARALVERRVIACANILPDVRSTYRWKEKVVVEREQLVVMKLTRSTVGPLKAAIAELHSYEVPELLVFDVADGLPAYLDWVRAEARVDS